MIFYGLLTRKLGIVIHGSRQKQNKLQNANKSMHETNLDILGIKLMSPSSLNHKTTEWNNLDGIKYLVVPWLRQ